MLLKEEYGLISDEDLIEQFHNGNKEIMDFILDKYKNLVKKKARVLFIIGGDTDDLIQEGMIGLYKAVRDFNPKKENSFFNFANLCINRQMYTAISASKRKKHSPLNSSVSLFENGSEKVLPDELGNPEKLLIDREKIEDIDKAIQKNLSNYEKTVFEYYLEGNSYTEIAEKIQKSPKSVDNAIQRIKGKIKEFV